MKKLMLVVMFLVLVITPVLAAVEMDVGAKVDAPNLIKVTKNVTIGLEASKGMLSDALNGDTRYWVEDDKGYEGYVKITYSGTLFSFVK